MPSLIASNVIAASAMFPLSLVVSTLAILARMP
jgi:hypothetical protein